MNVHKSYRLNKYLSGYCLFRYDLLHIEALICRLCFRVFIPIVKQENHEQSIVLLRNGAYDPDKVKLQDLFKANMMAMDIGLLEDDRGVINGMHVLQDMSLMNVSHMFSPAMAKKGMTLFQHAYPNRPKGVHFFNLPSFFETLFGLIKPLLSEKMKNRVTRKFQ